MRDAKQSIHPETAPTAADGWGSHGEDRLPSGDIIVADGLPLERLYARFDAIARGRAHGDSSAAHQSVIARLASNQRRAEALGWTAFVLERVGGTGRLELFGTTPNGRDRAVVPDAIPYDAAAPIANTVPAQNSPAPDGIAHSVGSERTNISWQSRMTWLDDGGR
jgi:hypothetical protein